MARTCNGHYYNMTPKVALVIAGSTRMGGSPPEPHPGLPGPWIYLRFDVDVSANVTPMLVFSIHYA